MSVAQFFYYLDDQIIDWYRYEGQIAQLEQQAWNMESTQLTTENLRNTMATVDAMKTANKELKRQYGKIDVDKIEVGL
jgi:charged multivesicular body protein 5